MRVELDNAQNHQFFHSLDTTLRQKVDRGGRDEDKKQKRNNRNKINPSKLKKHCQSQNGMIAEDFDEENGEAGPSQP